MGTRADFYVRKDNQMKWLGSKAFDGYPDGIAKNVLKATTTKEFESEVELFLKSKCDSTLPNEGWPWPWEDSSTTDYSYIFENGKVMASCFGYKLFDPLIGEDDEEEEFKMKDYFPNMKQLQNVKLSGKGSGLLVVSINNDGIIDIT